MVRREYTIEERAAVLAVLDANQGHVRKTARDTGIPYPTLQHWIRERAMLNHPGSSTPKPPPEPTAVQVEAAVPDARTALDKLWETVLRNSLEGITLDKIGKADVVKLATVAGIATDKMRLLRGESLTNDDRGADPFDVLMAAFTASRTAGPPTKDGEGSPGIVAGRSSAPDDRQWPDSGPLASNIPALFGATETVVVQPPMRKIEDGSLPGTQGSVADPQQPGGPYQPL
jgi:hypothetical protein